MLRNNVNALFAMGITLLFLCLSIWGGGPLNRLDLYFYDLMIDLAPVAAADSPIVIVEMDDTPRTGSQSWSRAFLAEGIRKIREGGAKAIGLDLNLEMPKADAGLEKLKAMAEAFEKTLTGRKGPRESEFLESIHHAILNSEGNTALAEAIAQAGVVVLPIYFKDISSSPEIPIKEQIALLTPYSLKNVCDPPEPARLPDHAALPPPALLSSAEGIGHKIRPCEADGICRKEMLVHDYRGACLPSFALAAVIQYLGIDRNEIEKSDDGLRLGRFAIPTDSSSKMLINFRGPSRSFKVYSLVDVIEGKTPSRRFKNKVVLVADASRQSDSPLRTPVDPKMSEPELTANIIETLLSRKFIDQPWWRLYVQISAILFLGALIIFLLPKLKTLTAGLVSAGLVLACAGGSLWLFKASNLWITPVSPILLLVFGFMGVLIFKRPEYEPLTEKAAAASPEMNRMLALTFQSEGMLDMAFDKLRLIPADEETKKLLYSIALDYEKKKQFGRAVEVYEYIEEHDRQYRDIQRRKRNLMTSGETMVLGDTSGGGEGADMASASGRGGRLTSLGRYKIIKEIGRGAMGTVYLGQDPRINRTTAIKTFRFTEEFEPEEIEKMKALFFREAESAGTLSHANIVTIYDAGEEEGLAYIAMEYLKGTNLGKFTARGNLLPMRKTIDYVAAAANALDFAHQRGIVHRDIKPANIMLLTDGTVKITDFGIARIASTSRTQSGVVKGTPFYMSPEQFSGEQVDGRSDIFSLGVMLFQLLTGTLPFSGKTPIELMQQIIKTPHPDPKTYNPKIVTPLVKVIDKALEKDRDKRYQRASQMAAHLREIGKRIDQAIAKWKAKQKETAGA